MSEDHNGIKVVATNRCASFDYELGERYEAGIALTGWEIKSIRAGKMDLRDAFVQIRDGEAWLINAYVPTYEHSTGFALNSARGNERRERRLLLHKKEIADLARSTEARGYTIIPTRVYLKRGRAKVEIALARGKKLYDKRQAIAKRDAEREVQRAIREHF
ncbi:MAG: SsrA-binding protein SmpB [Thermoflexales bacterium]|nr:SsrA-binding protein SmpB [Thermoflexales bacterium]